MLIILGENGMEESVLKRVLVTYGLAFTLVGAATLMAVSVITSANQPLSTADAGDSGMVMLASADLGDTSTTPENDPLEKVIELPVADGETITVGITRSYLSGNFDSVPEAAPLTSPGEVSIPSDELTTTALSISNISKTLDEQAEAERVRLEEETKQKELERQKAEEEAQRNKEREEANARVSQLEVPDGFLLGIAEPDTSYTGKSVSVTGDERLILEKLVMGEAGNQGFNGAALVAQCIRDAMVYDGYSSISEVRSALGYTGKLQWEPNQNVIDAVAYIFDQGQSAVQHRILYFYSSNGGWHETQHFIVELGAHRFFDRWW